MPELPEVETVKNKLKTVILNKKITSVSLIYINLIEYPTSDEFLKKIINQNIVDIKRLGKWLMFELDDYYLLSHLRMEGKFNIKNPNDKIEKHEHICFTLDSDISLRYNDTRKFGRMHLIEKDKIYERKPLSLLGFEPFDSKLDYNYLKNKFKNKSIPIKTSLLDQSIITGIGNIYANEILFKSKINPFKKSSELNKLELNEIIVNTITILKNAIEKGGTTIRTYTSSEGVHGNFQNDLLVHGREKEKCFVCETEILKVKINGRGTYYCPNCQK